MFRVRHTYIRAKLAGLYSVLPMGLGLLVFGGLLTAFGYSNITPSSVSVRGYYRANGTYVRPYHRRPPGSVSHDQPYEFAALCGLGLLLGGMISTGSFVHGWWKKSDFELLPPLGYVSTLPPPPVKPRVPDAFAKARKSWHCRRCSQVISVGDRYCYFSNLAPHAERQRFCTSCTSAVAMEARQYNQQAAAYARLAAEEQQRVVQMGVEQYHAAFGSYASAAEVRNFVQGQLLRQRR